MDSGLFTMSGGESSSAVARVTGFTQWAYQAMIIILCVWIMVKWWDAEIVKTPVVPTKEGLMYWGASTSSVRDDYGTAVGQSLNEINEAKQVNKAYQDTTGVPVAPVAAATFVGARQHMTERMTPEEKLLQEQKNK